MLRATLIFGLAAVVLCTAVAAAGLLPNGDFEAGLTGWQVKADPGATVTASNDKPAAGKASLLLQSNGQAPAWAMSPQLESAQPGQALQVTFSVRRVQPAVAAALPSTLLLDLVGSLAEVGDFGIWEAALPADTNWHKISLLLKVPPLGGGAAACLAFGAIGGPGAWRVDEVSAQPATLLAFAPADQIGDKPSTARLPEGWDPKGTLDATSQSIGAQTELLINVNGIQVGVLPQLTCYRGVRQPMLLLAVNRGSVDKTLHTEFAGPDYMDCPTWDVPIKKNGTTTFRLAVQSLRQGEAWTKLTFTSAGQSAAVPVKVICQPSYPTLGGYWQDQVDPALLPAEVAAPLDLQVLAAAPDLAAFAPMVAAVKAAGLEYVAAPIAGSLTGAQYLAATSPLLDQLQPSFWLPYCDGDPSASFVAAPGLAAALRKKQISGGVFTPPLQLTRDCTKNCLLPTKATLLTADRATGLLALTCRLPRQRAACVLSEQVDDKADTVGGSALAQSRQSDLGGVRALLTAHQLSMPLLVDRLQGAPAGDDRLAALSLAKILVNCLYQASTGVTFDVPSSTLNAFTALPAKDDQGNARPVATVLRVIQEELSSAGPLVPLLNSADVSVGCDTPITYRPFLRGGEGIVVLWNNTSAPKNVTLEFRSQPVVSRRVALSYGGEFDTTRWEPIMKFSEESFKRGIPSVFLRLEPLQVQICSYRLLDPSVAWLRNVSLTVPYVAPPKETPVDRRDSRTWWTDMLKGSQSKDLGK